MSISLKRAGRLSARLTVVLLLLAVTAPAALAHAKLERSLPKAGSKPDQPPKLVELWFSEELRQGFSSIEVKDKAGRRVDRGEVTHSEDGKKAQVELEELEAGAYTVIWKVLSADEHTIRGRFTFTVTAAATSAAAAAVTPEPTPEATPEVQDVTAPAREEALAESEDSPITAADSVVRWLGYLSIMALAGGFALWLFVLGPALKPIRDEGIDPEGGRSAAGVAARRSLTLFRISVVTLILSTLLALAFQSAAVHGVGLGGALAPARLVGVIADTGYGKSWLIQAVGAAVVLVVVLLLGRAVGRDPEVGQKGLWTAGLAASALLMLGPSLTGHAAVAAKDYPLAALSDWLHLLAGGFWVGGLFHLALALPQALSKLPRPSRADALGRVIPLFTRVAAPAVALVLLAGLYNSWLHLGGWAALWGTPYGRTLLVKLLLVLAMLALGALNNFYFGKRVKRRAGEAADDTGRGFARSLRLEAALGVLVLLVTAFLVFTTPGRNDATASNPSRGPAAAAGHR